MQPLRLRSLRVRVAPRGDRDDGGVDATKDPRRRQGATVRAYDAAARAYRDATAALPTHLGPVTGEWGRVLGAGARVLEIGSGSGRDAAALEEVGLSVQRTDVTPAFVTLLQDDGHDAVVLDPVVDDLADPADPDRPWDGVWASASLLHAARAELPRVLARAAAATREGGRLHLSLKEGDGEGWSTHGAVAQPRFFTYWREGPLRAALADAGWAVDRLERRAGLRADRWLVVAGVRRFCR